MNSIVDFEDFLSQYNITINEFIDMYSAFSELDKEIKLEIFQEYGKSI